MLKTRVESLERDVALLIREDLSPEAQGKLFADAAREIILEVDRANDAAAGRDLEYQTFVDGREDESLSTVRLASTVVATWATETAIFADILDLLRNKAPVLRGRYRDSITLFADGQPADPDSPPKASEYFFAATVPYARKIERGQKGYSPGAVFEGVAAVAGKRFGNMGRVRYGFRSLQGGAIGAWAATTTIGRRGRTRQEWLTRQPAIIITLR